MPEAAFPNTSWTAVFTARAGGDTSGEHAALGRLCQQYWYPLYAFARRWGLGPEDAEDATQSFFAALTKDGVLAGADPARGKLRTFFLAAFQRDLVDFKKAARREKRGGGRVVSLDHLAAEERIAAEPAASAQEIFDHAWALEVLDAAVARLEQNYATTERAGQFAALRPSSPTATTTALSAPNFPLIPPPPVKPCIACASASDAPCATKSPARSSSRPTPP